MENAYFLSLECNGIFLKTQGLKKALHIVLQFQYDTDISFTKQERALYIYSIMIKIGITAYHKSLLHLDTEKNLSYVNYEYIYSWSESRALLDKKEHCTFIYLIMIKVGITANHESLLLRYDTEQNLLLQP